MHAPAAGDWGLEIGDWGLGIGDWGRIPFANHIAIIAQNFHLQPRAPYLLVSLSPCLPFTPRRLQQLHRRRFPRVRMTDEEQSLPIDDGCR
ncbi:MAG: hypothetical protein CVU38_21175 [Chloroflexi bacterium HGW-Chloroflexi-1]|nr:MAG: hypothetical protein CVU38_21175 [Chloroflexi bacterium HGW-Chloroflexi-1]